MGTVWMLLRKVATLSVGGSGTTSAWVSVSLMHQCEYPTTLCLFLAVILFSLRKIYDFQDYLSCALFVIDTITAPRGYN